MNSPCYEVTEKPELDGVSIDIILYSLFYLILFRWEILFLINSNFRISSSRLVVKGSSRLRCGL